MSKKVSLYIIILIVVAGITSYLILTEKPISQIIPGNQTQSIEKVALLSFTEFFCFWTESSAPYAYFQFAYQEEGEIKYIKTKTTCDDLIKKDITNDASKNPTLFGEKITLEYKDGNPIKVTRENGDTYRVENSEKIRSFFSSEINTYSNLKYYQNSNPSQVVEECSMISDDDQHDRCLSFQAAFQVNTDICGEMRIASNQNLCSQWVSNIQQGSVNK